MAAATGVELEVEKEKEAVGEVGGDTASAAVVIAKLEGNLKESKIFGVDDGSLPAFSRLNQ